LQWVSILVRNFHQIFPSLFRGTYFVLPPIFAITTLLKQKNGRVEVIAERILAKVGRGDLCVGLQATK
jgi:hypothetical protein